MILHPPILALLIGSFLTSFMLLYAASYGVSILRRWDLKSGSEAQLCLERKTYLISTMVSYAFGFQLLSLFLFIYTADDLCRLFTGAMCAAGTLFVNAYGYPTLIYKIVNFLLAGSWLILNYVDNKAYDYPLIKSKYAMLLFMTPLVVMETFMQFQYFLQLKPDIITSCCGSLFSAAGNGVSSSIAAFSGLWVRTVFFACMGLTLVSGIYVYRNAGRGGFLFSLMSGASFAVSVMAIISFLSLYFYELPTHHCPFCLLQREYGYVGYLLYFALFGGAVNGIGVGSISLFRKVASLAEIIPPIQRTLALVSVICYGTFLAVVTWKIIFSNLRM
jgi:hypothetical protein